MLNISIQKWLRTLKYKQYRRLGKGWVGSTGQKSIDSVHLVYNGCQVENTGVTWHHFRMCRQYEPILARGVWGYSHSLTCHCCVSISIPAHRPNTLTRWQLKEKRKWTFNSFHMTSMRERERDWLLLVYSGTLGTISGVHFMEVSWFQGLVSMQIQYLGPQ